MNDPLAIPAFLIISQERRAAAWRGRKTTKVKDDSTPKINVDSEGRALPMTMSPEAWALLRSIEKPKDDKKKAFFASKEAEREAARSA